MGTCLYLRRVLYFWNIFKIEMRIVMKKLININQLKFFLKI